MQHYPTAAYTNTQAAHHPHNFAHPSANSSHSQQSSYPPPPPRHHHHHGGAAAHSVSSSASHNIAPPLPSTHANTSHLPNSTPSHAYAQQQQSQLGSSINGGETFGVVAGSSRTSPQISARTSTASVLDGRGAGGGIETSTGHGELYGQDMILQAIDRMGQRMENQISRLSFQVAEMQVVVDRLVEQQRNSVRTADGDPGVSSWQQQREHYEKDINAHINPRAFANVRGGSEHPFAFDPAVDTTNDHGSGAQVTVPSEDSYHLRSQQNDHHHQTGQQTTFRGGPSGGPEGHVNMEHSHPSDTFLDSSHAQEAASTSNVGLSPHPHRNPMISDGGDTLGGVLNFSAGDGSTSDVGGRVSSPQDQRLRDSYAATSSARPFTAVDHSHRPKLFSGHEAAPLLQSAGRLAESGSSHGNNHTTKEGEPNNPGFDLQNTTMGPPVASSYSALALHPENGSSARGLVPSLRHGMGFNRVSPRQLASTVSTNGRFQSYLVEDGSGQSGLDYSTSTASALAGHVHHRSLYTDSAIPSEQAFQAFPSQSYGHPPPTSQLQHHQNVTVPTSQSYLHSPQLQQREQLYNTSSMSSAAHVVNDATSPTARNRSARASSSGRHRANSAATIPFSSPGLTADTPSALRKALRREAAVTSARIVGATHPTSTSPDTGGSAGLDHGPIGPMGSYQFWAFSPPQPPESSLRLLPEPQFRTLQSARLDLQRKTGRTMAKLGRLPLKDYLEVSPQEYLHARKTGRAVYNEWLEPLVRMAKQSKDRVKACTNFIEYTHPMLAQCEGSFKARQLLQQIVDNAIDEATNARKKDFGGGSVYTSAHSAVRGVREIGMDTSQAWSVASGDHKTLIRRMDDDRVRDHHQEEDQLYDEEEVGGGGDDDNNDDDDEDDGDREEDGEDDDADDDDDDDEQDDDAEGQEAVSEGRVGTEPEEGGRKRRRSERDLQEDRLAQE